jgi:hypothetical protein
MAPKRIRHMTKFVDTFAERVGWVGATRQTLWGAVALLTASIAVPVYAETIDLVCNRADGGGDVFVSIDTTASTAKSWANILTRNDVAANPATITNDLVTWTAAISQPNAVDKFTFDRNTGAFNEMEAAGRSYSWTCKKAAKVF